MREISKIIIYGGGIRGKRLCKILWESRSSIEIVAIVDSNPKLWGTQCYGYTISEPALILKDHAVPICIAAAHEKAVQNITELLVNEYHYRLEDIIGYVPFLLNIWQSRAQTLPAGVFQEKNINPAGSGVIFDFFCGAVLGGSEAWAKGLCEGLLKQGWSNIRICANEDRFATMSPPKEWETLSGSIDCLGNDPEIKLEKRVPVDTLQYFIGKMPCVIVTTYIETLCAACVLKRLYPAQIRIVSTIHMGYEGMYDDYSLLRDDVDAYVGVSQNIQRGVVERGVENERAFLMRIPFSCNKDMNHFYTEDYFQPVRLGYAGRMQVQQKRMDLLLKVIEVLVEKKVQFKLEIAGAGDFEGSVRAFIAEHRLENQVRVIGQLPREEIPAFWKRQDVCVNISDFEGRSISITEAMGNGAVPVVTDVSGVRDDIVDGVNGFIVPVGGVEEMADRIEYLSNHRELLRPMGTAAHDEVYPKSLMEPHVQFWEELLTRMTDSLRT